MQQGLIKFSLPGPAPGGNDFKSICKLSKKGGKKRKKL